MKEGEGQEGKGRRLQEKHGNQRKGNESNRQNGKLVKKKRKLKMGRSVY